MPNWVRNDAKITGKKTDLDKLVHKIKSAESEFDFNRIIPEPKTKEECEPRYYRTETSHVQKDDDKPWFNWYEWNWDNWGTKWNACEVCVHREDDNHLHVSFDTAWSFPEPIWEKLASIYPSLSFNVDYADEDIGSNCGTFVAEHGAVDYVEPDDPEQFAMGIWGYDWDEVAEWWGEEEANRIFGER